MPSRRSVLVLASVSAHVAVLVAIFVASLMATGTIPTPFNRLAFEIDRSVRLVDVTLPAQPATKQRTPSDNGAALVSNPVAAAPVDAPPTITPDTSDDVAVAPEGLVQNTRDVASVVQGLGVAEIPPTLPPIAPRPQTPVRIGPGLVAPRKIFHVDPLYPSIARSAHVEGVVILEAVIDRSGRVESARVLRSTPMLNQAALDAVRQWRFTPTLLNGVAVPIVMTVTVTFRLGP